MDEHGLPIVGSGVDYKKVPSMEHRNTLVFLNQFIMQTTKFLNRFASVCEDRLLDLSKRIQKLDVSLSILESKLQSIKSLNEIQASKQYEAPGILLAAGNEPPPTQTSQSQPNEPPAAAISSVPPPPPTTSDVAATSEDVSDQNANVMKIKDHPDYVKFFKMKRLGVNPLQIAMEMKKLGLNPDLLEDENAPAPSGTGNNKMNIADDSDSDDSDDDESSLSSSSNDSFD